MTHPSFFNMNHLLLHMWRYCSLKPGARNKTALISGEVKGIIWHSSVAVISKRSKVTDWKVFWLNQWDAYQLYVHKSMNHPGA